MKILIVTLIVLFLNFEEHQGFNCGCDPWRCQFQSIVISKKTKPSDIIPMPPNLIAKLDSLLEFKPIFNKKQIASFEITLKSNNKKKYLRTINKSQKGKYTSSAVKQYSNSLNFTVESWKPLLNQNSEPEKLFEVLDYFDFILEKSKLKK